MRFTPLQTLLRRHQRSFFQLLIGCLLFLCSFFPWLYTDPFHLDPAGAQSPSPGPIQLYYDGELLEFSETDAAIAFAISQGITERAEIISFINTTLGPRLSLDPITTSDITDPDPQSLSDIDGDGTPGTSADAAALFAFTRGNTTVPAVESFCSDILDVPCELFPNSVLPTGQSPTPIPVSDFTFTLDFFDNTLTPSQQAIVQAAADRWSEIITQDVPDFTLPGTIEAGFCGPGYPEIPIGTFVDDILVQVSAASLLSEPNEPGDVLGQAGPCGFSQDGSGIISTAVLAFDPFDIDTLEAEGGSILFEVTLHELGHTLGIGANWEQFELGNPASAFNGPEAVAEYNNLGGVGNIPLQLGGGHWDEPVFDNELMTPILILGGGISNPLSRITAGALDDLNFPGVNRNAADNYTLPGALTAEFLPAGARIVDMSGDAILGPLLSPDGQVILPRIVIPHTKADPANSSQVIDRRL